MMKAASSAPPEPIMTARARRRLSSCVSPDAPSLRVCSLSGTAPVPPAHSTMSAMPEIPASTARKGPSAIPARALSAPSALPMMDPRDHQAWKPLMIDLPYADSTSRARVFIAESMTASAAQKKKNARANTAGTVAHPMTTRNGRDTRPTADVTGTAPQRWMSGAARGPTTSPPAVPMASTTPRPASSNPRLDWISARRGTKAKPRTPLMAKKAVAPTRDRWSDVTAGSRRSCGAQPRQGSPEWSPD